MGVDSGHDLDMARCAHGYEEGDCFACLAEHAARYRWHHERNKPLRVLATAIALVDAEPELAEMGPDGLPVAWRIFRPGWNTSRNGPVYFDSVAAELVMADYREHGARIQVDMDHVSLNKESAAYDPRGLGYHGLELRPDGSLWAAAATWTERGAAMLRAKDGKAAELPYYSPAFDVDSDLEFGDEPDRVTFVFNGGLVGTPATDRPMALAAASRRKGRTSMDPQKALKIFRAMSATDRERLMQIWRLTPSQAELPSAKLAGLLKWQDGAEDVDPKVLAKMVSAMGGDASQGIGGLMRQLRQFMEMAMKALMGEQPAPEAVPTEEPEMMADNPGDKEREQQMLAASRHSEELRQLRREAAARDKLVDELRQERAAEREEKRMRLLARAVETKRLARAMAYEDPTVEAGELKPKGSFASMPLDELQTWTEGPVLTGIFGPGPQPASGYTGAVTQPGLFQLSELEEKRVTELAKANGRDPRKAWDRYLDQRTIQCRGATGAELRVMGRRYSNDYRHPDARSHNIVLSGVDGTFTPQALETYRTWASQQPIEMHSAVSIAALREFDLRYATLIAAARIMWVEEVGELRPSASIGDTTFPIDFEEIFYKLKTAQGPGLETPQLWSIDVRKDRYEAGATANLELLETPGSFDYMTNTWLAKADKMVRARDRVIARLAAAIMSGNPYLYERFLDGELQRLTDKLFFAIDHPINPFKPEVADINENTTWSNYETTATPFEPEALTKQKAEFRKTPDFAGEFLNMGPSHVLSPTCLAEEVENKLSVQDLILSKAVVGGTDIEGQVRSPHTGSGLLNMEIPDLPGEDLDADWYIFSMERKQAGYVPFAVSTSAAEKVTIYGPDSDRAKDTGFIVERRETDLRAVPIHPQALRKITGKTP